MYASAVLIKSWVVELRHNYLHVRFVGMIVNCVTGKSNHFDEVLESLFSPNCQEGFEVFNKFKLTQFMIVPTTFFFFVAELSVVADC